MKNKLFWFVVILLGALSRLIPHEANFVPLGAIALFSSAYAPKKYAFLVPTLSMLISDVFLGFYPIAIWVYSSFAIISLIGLLLRRNVNLQNILLSALLSSVVFYLITNFGVWAFTNMYSKNLRGLIECYTLAIPFFRNTFLSDQFYSFSLFFGYYLIRNWKLLQNNLLILRTNWG